MKIKKYIFLVLLVLSQNTAFGDSFSWAGEGITTQTGSLSDLKNANKIKYKFGYRSGGFGHLESAIEICWYDPEGKKHKQIIFEGMIDWTVKNITTNKSNSEIRVEFRKPCAPDPEDIIQPTLIYVFNADKQKFEQQK